MSKDRIALAIREVFPNCPKYIQRRRLLAVKEPTGSKTPALGVALDAARQDMISQADTLFVASCHPERGADVSHRGGPVGFVRVIDERILRIPDYPGNSMFKTLGNFEVHKAAGLIIPEFARGQLLQLTGAVSLFFGKEDPRHPSKGTGRYWDFHIERWRESSAPTTHRWEFGEFSPFNP